MVHCYHTSVSYLGLKFMICNIMVWEYWKLNVLHFPESFIFFRFYELPSTCKNKISPNQMITHCNTMQDITFAKLHDCKRQTYFHSQTKTRKNTVVYGIILRGF